MDRDDIDLPEGSIFDAEDYVRMSEVASTSLATDILTKLGENDQLSKGELVKSLKHDIGDISSTIKDLQRVALICNRRKPTTDSSETYSYYTLTGPGRILLRDGVEDGVRALTQREYEAIDKYSR